VPAASLPARGRPPQAAARRAGLEVVEEVVTSWNYQRIDRPPLMGRPRLSKPVTRSGTAYASCGHLRTGGVCRGDCGRIRPLPPAGPRQILPLALRFSAAVFGVVSDRAAGVWRASCVGSAAAGRVAARVLGPASPATPAAMSLTWLHSATGRAGQAEDTAGVSQLAPAHFLHRGRRWLRVHQEAREPERPPGFAAPGCDLAAKDRRPL
jgi:hypothetical protein